MAFEIKRNALVRNDGAPSAGSIADRPDDPIRYIIFTSGSTGEPKGVRITRAAAEAFLEWMVKDFGFSAADVFINQAPFSFDLSVYELFTSLHMGGTLLLNDAETAKDSHRFLDRIKQHHGSVWVSTPTFAYVYLTEPAFNGVEIPSIRSFLFCGESLPKVRQELVGTYFIDIAAMFFAMPQALYPALAGIYGDKYVGFFPAALAGGALIASITSGWTHKIHRHGLMVTIAAVLWGVAIVFFGLADSIIPALLFLTAAGFFDMISGIFRGSIWNQTIPNYLRGRLASIEMMSYLTGPMLGSAKMGLVAEKFGVKTALVSGGVLCVAAVIGAAVFLPKFTNYDGREGVKQREIEEAERIEMMRMSETEF